MKGAFSCVNAHPGLTKEPFFLFVYVFVMATIASCPKQYSNICLLYTILQMH